MKTKAGVMIPSQQMIDGIINHQELANVIGADNVAEHNNRLCERRMRNYIYDNPQQFKPNAFDSMNP